MLRNLATMSTAAVMSQLLPILAAPVLLRLYAPEAYGTYLALTVLTNLGSTIVTGRFELAIHATKSARRVRGLARASLLTAGFTTIGLTMLTWWLASPLSALVNTDLSNFVYFVPIQLFSVGVSEILRALSWRNGNFALTSMVLVGSSAVTVATQFGLGVLGAGAHGVVVGAAVGQLVGAVALLCLLRKSLGGFSARERMEARVVATQFSAYPRLTALAGLVHMVGSIIPAAVMSAVYGPSVAGLYYLGSRLVAVPVSVLSNSVNPVFLSRSAELWRNKKPGTLKLFRTFVSLLLLAMAPGCLLFIWGDALFGTLFGSAWGPAGSMAAWIVVGSAVHLAATSTSILTALRYNNLHAWWAGMNLVLSAVAGGLVAGLAPSPIDAVAYFAVGTALSYAGLIAINARVIWHNEPSLSRSLTLADPAHERS